MEGNILNKLEIGHHQKNNIKMIHLKKNVQMIMVIQLLDYYKKMYLMINIIG